MLLSKDKLARSRLVQSVRAACSAALAIVIAVSCDSATGDDDVAHVQIMPGAATIYVDTDSLFQGAALDDHLQALSGRKLTWTSGDTSIATVSNAGVVHGVRSGNTVVVASNGGH